MTKRALVFGSNGPKSIGSLTYAAADAENVALALEGKRCGYEVTPCSPEAPGPIIEAANKLAAASQQDDTLLFFFSGHGVLHRKSLYLILDNSAGNSLIDTALNVERLLVPLRDSSARQKLLILDCCHAGAAPGFKSVDEAPDLGGENALVLMASERLEKAREFKELQGGFLSSMLCRAIGSEFYDADRDRDLRLSAGDLKEWLKDRAVYWGRELETSIPSPIFQGRSSGAFYLADQSEWSAEFVSHAGFEFSVLPIKPDSSGAWGIARHPTTNGQFRDYMNTTGCQPRGRLLRNGKWSPEFSPMEDSDFCREDSPVVCVSYDEASAFCSWLSGLTDLEFQLPSTYLWDMVAFGEQFPSNNPDSWQRFLPQRIWHQETCPGLPSADREQNHALQDLFGNVWEWCEGGAIRGGSYDHDFMSESVRRVYRDESELSRDTRNSDLGFRVAARIPLSKLSRDVLERLALCKEANFSAVRSRLRPAAAPGPGPAGSSYWHQIQGQEPSPPAAPHPEGTDSRTLVAYLKAIRAEANHRAGALQRRLIGREVPFMELEVVSGRGESQQLQLLLNSGKRPNTRIVLLGAPGSGKTNLLCRIAREFASPTDTSGTIPILVSLRQLLSSRVSIFDYIESRPSATPTAVQGVGSILEARAELGTVVFLLDGLDECAHADRTRAEIVVRELALSWPDAAIVVTSRPFGYVPLGGGFEEWQIGSPSIASREQFMRALVSEGHEHTWPAAWDGVPPNQSLTPLSLTLSGTLLSRGEVPATLKGELHLQVVAFLLEGKHRAEGPRLTCTATTRALYQAIAFSMTRSARRSLTLAEVVEGIASPTPLSPIVGVEPTKAGLQELLVEGARISGIFDVRDNGETWAFSHEAFREVLAAEALRTLGEASFEDLASELQGWEGWWVEPFSILGGISPRCSGAQQRLSWVAKANKILGLAMYSELREIDETALHSFLSCYERASDRSQVYEGVPQKFSDAERAVGFLLNRARQTFSGDDLYLIERVLTRVASEGVAGQTCIAQEAIPRLLKHIPSPPSELSLDGDSGGRPTWIRVGVPPDSELWVMTAPVTWEQFRLFTPGHMERGDP